MQIPAKIVAFDIETEGKAEDDKIIGITVASTVTNDGEERAWYTKIDNVPQPKMDKATALDLLHYLDEKQKAGYVVIAWNGASFDLKMIGYLAEDLPLAGRITLNMYDPMFQILSQKGFAVGLAAAAKGLGIEQTKLMNGADAPEAWANKEYEKVISYVIGDSQMTVSIFVEICKADGIKWITKNGKASYAPFKKNKTVAECLADPDIDQSWQEKPMNRHQMVAWIPATVRGKAKAEVEKAESRAKGDSEAGVKPILLVVSGPSGTGKTVLCDELSRTMPSLKKSVTTTTREARTGEINGVDYNFVSKDVFDKMIADKKFLEWAEVHGNKYGSSKDDISIKLAKSQDVVMIVDVQGAKSIREFVNSLPDKVKTQFCFADVFIMPPSIEELKNRLMKRGKDTPEVIETRLANASSEMSQANLYKYTIVSDAIDKSWDKLRSVVIAERCISKK
jgi:guanylate kinase